jgi:hypothetical protein
MLELHQHKTGKRMEMFLPRQSFSGTKPRLAI